MPISEPPDRPLLSIEQLIFLHTVAIVEFGGAEGIRDRGELEAALARPLAGFGRLQLFTTPFARAAALMESLLRNHGFVDGNKRTAVMAAAFWLEREGYVLEASQSQMVEAVVSVTERQLSHEKLTLWFEAHVRQKED